MSILGNPRAFGGIIPSINNTHHAAVHVVEGVNYSQPKVSPNAVSHEVAVVGLVGQAASAAIALLVRDFQGLPGRRPEAQFLPPWHV